VSGGAAGSRPVGPGNGREAPAAPRPGVVATELVVGLAADDIAVTSDAATALADQLARCFPGVTSEVVVVGPGGMAVPTGGPGRPAVFTGGFLGSESLLPAALEWTQLLDARVCAVVGPRPSGAGGEWLRLLLAPVVEGRFDYVCPAYRRRKLDGALNNAIVYPLTRALFGKRLRQPLGGELAISRRLADELVSDTEWATDPLHAGADVWLVAKALSRRLEICQAFLGERPERAAPRGADVSDTVARVVGLLFHEMERHAGVWQRISGSELVPTFGDGSPLDDETVVPVAPMVEAFELAYRELRAVWGMLIPPGDLLALKRVTGQPPDSFNLDDGLWARLVYDFALAFHAGVAPEGQLLRALTPLYLAWVASFVNQARSSTGTQVEARLERLCDAFEAHKAHLISGWRWPDRFNP